MKNEYMSPGFAVFNCHVNNAKKRANKSFIEKFGRSAFNRTMLPLFRRGIMTIFHELPTEKTQYWVDQVTAFVNEDRQAPAAEGRGT